MIPDYIINLILVFSGFGTGVVVGIGSGTAGGVIIPLLTILYGSKIHNSIGTSLIVDIFIGAIAGLIFFKKKNVDIKAVIALIIPGVIGAFIGSRFTLTTSESDLSLLIGIILIFLGINFLIYGIRKNVEYINSKVNFTFLYKRKIPILILLGFIAGIMSGFSGISGGAIVALVLIFALGYELHTAIGTSLVMLFFIAGAGVFGHSINNNVDFNIGIVIGLAAAIGAFSGSYIANKIDENKLGRVIGLVVLILGIAMIFKIFY